jgi:glutamate racemase
MTGIFDSGRGGLTALYELRRLCPDENIIFFADKENAPYGPRSKGELEKIVRANVKRLLDLGADRVLMACCTASTVYDSLPDELRRRSIEIITPAAKIAAERSLGTVGVISTEATYKSLSFPRAISKIRGDISVISAYSPELVELVEGGCRDGGISEREEKIIKNSLLPFAGSGADVLILGCTHFTHLKRKIEEITGIPTVSPSLIGARLAAEEISGREKGEVTFL